MPSLTYATDARNTHLEVTDRYGRINVQTTDIDGFRVTLSVDRLLAEALLSGLGAVLVAQDAAARDLAAEAI